MNAALASAAMQLVGVRFRLHGRDPATGLDCVGVVAEAMRRAGFDPVVPAGYSLRNASVTGLLPFASTNHLEPAPAAEADVVLVMVNPVQPHLAVCTPHGFVHAHAGIGRVTYLPGPLPWPITSGWRVPRSTQSIGN